MSAADLWASPSAWISRAPVAAFPSDLLRFERSGRGHLAGQPAVAAACRIIGVAAPP